MYTDMELDRREAANTALLHFDFGDWEIKDISVWQDQGGDEYSLTLFIDTGEDKEGYGTSRKEMFVVRFKPGSAEVVDRYLAG